MAVAAAPQQRAVGQGTATTKAPSGSFEVRRVVVDAPGTDKLVFRARNPRTDEVCRGVVRFDPAPVRTY